MAHLELRAFIAATPEAVWAVLADLEGQQAEWMADVRRLEVVTERKRVAGTVLHVTSELFGLPLVKDTMEITAWEPPRRMEVLHRGQFHGTGRFLLAAGRGGTIFTWTEDFTPPLGAVGELAFTLVVRRHLRRVFGRSVENVRRISEGAATRDRDA